MEERPTKPIDTILSPIKGYMNRDGSKLKAENQSNFINSPFPQDIKTPAKIMMDWGSLMPKMCNGETPMNGSGLYSPIVSANPQRTSYANFGAFSMVQKNLLNEFSPCKPYIPQSTPHQRNQSTIDRELSKENRQDPKTDFLFMHCKNLTKAFDSIAQCPKEEDFIDVNESLTHFDKIKAAIYGNPQAKVNIHHHHHQCIGKKNFEHIKQGDLIENGQCVSIGHLNFNLLKTFHNINEDDMSNDEDSYENNEEIKEEDEDMISQDDDVDNKPNIIESTMPQFISANTGECQQCKCTKSKCLKLYCECFANGKYCKGCYCVDCLNREEYEGQRRKAYKRIMSKNPKAILKMKSSKKSWNCKCKNSSCQKNYCDCFQNGKFCSSKCKCFDCRNKPPAKRSRGYVRKQKKAIVPKLIHSNVNSIRKESHSHLQTHSHCHRKKRVVKEDVSTPLPIPVVSHYDAMYTPQKKNYRTVKSEIKNSISTAAFTELTMSIDNKPKRRKSQRKTNEDNGEAHANVCKKLEMKDGNGICGIFQ